MRFFVLLALTATIALCGAFSDPPRGWFSLSDPELGYSFNYPGEFRLEVAKDIKHRALELRNKKADIRLDVVELDALPSNETFAADERKKASEGTFQLLEDKPHWCFLSYQEGNTDVHRKALRGSGFAYLLTIRYQRDPDAKKALANAAVSVRIAKSLRRLGQ